MIYMKSICVSINRVIISSDIILTMKGENMKRKILVGLSLIYLATTASYAMDIQGGKLISHKEWTTGSVKALFADTKKDFKANISRKMRNLPSAIEQHDGIVLANSMPDQQGVVGEETPVVGFVSGYIENLTSTQQTYTINSFICSNMGLGQESDCANSTDIIQLNPNGFINLNKNITMSNVYKLAGNYWTVTGATVKKDGMSTMFASYAEGYLEITDAMHS